MDDAFIRLRLLHLSDLHARADREPERWRRRRRVLGRAWDDNLDAILDEAPVDLVCFTGDAADWGRREEFAEADEFLAALHDRLGLGRDRLFVVPGNHDVDRTVHRDSVAVGVAVSVTNIALLFRIPIYLFEAIHQTLLFARHRLLGTANLDTSPIFWHDLSYLPLPFLDRHIELTAKRDFALARRALEACARIPGQRGIGRRTLTRLQVRELEQIARERRFKDFVEGQAIWLPADPGADPLIVEFRQAARYLASVQTATIARHRRGHLNQATKALLGQARRDRGLTLPPLPEGPPFESATAWLESLERTAGERRILLCLDEFETLERSLPGSRRRLLQLMGLFRATIQHRRRVRLLVAGEAPFDELDAVWNDHFISVREVRIGHLDPETARELVRRPSDDFPEDALPDAVADRIVERTGAQPYLVQLYAQILVEALNAQERERARVDDVEAVEVEVLEQATYYFRNTWQRAPGPARSALAALARGEVPAIEPEARRWLERRCLIDGEGRLTIPVLGRFLVEEELA